MVMKIRKATKKDLDKISKLFYEYGEYEHSLDKSVEKQSIKDIKKQDKHFMKLGTIYLILEENKEPQGVLSLNLCLQGKERIGIIHTTIITDKARGKGYGKLLFNYALNFFKRKKCTRLRTLVHDKNKNAQGFWKSQGFELEKGYWATKRLK